MKEPEVRISRSSWVIFLLLVAIAILVALALGQSNKDKGLLKIVFLDVGQGDSIFIQTPNKNQLLIDGGPNKDVLPELGEVMPFFDRSIDAVLLTHPDADHLGGLVDVLDRYEVEHIIETGIECSTSLCDKWSQVSEDEGALISRVHAGYRVMLDGDIELSIVHPMREDLEGNPDKNDSSLVARLTYGSQSVLLTGDIEKGVERKMVFTVHDLDSDFLKVAHHGSKTSTTQEFLQAVTPISAFIQVGAKNRYGHPHPDVTGRLEQNNIPYYSTSTDGRITLLLDGQSYKIITEY